MELDEALQLAERRYRARIGAYARQLTLDLAQIKEEAAVQGVFSSSGTRLRLHERCAQEIHQRVRVAWEDCRTAIHTAHIAYSSDLPPRVREFVRTLTTSLLEDRTLRYPDSSGIPLDLETPYREVLDAADADIDLFASSFTTDGSTKASQSLFISHIVDDRAVAAALKALLLRSFSNGIRVFVASDYDSIRSGAEWHGVILEAIKEAGAIVVLLSEDSHDRPWINYEAGAGDVLNKLVIPAVIRGFAKDQLRAPLARRQARNLLEAGEIQALITDLAARLEVEAETLQATLVTEVVTAASRPSAYRTISDEGMRLAVFLCEHSVDALEWDPMFRDSDLLSQLGLDPEELELAIDELREAGWIVLSGGSALSPTLDLFVGMDPIIKGWTPRLDGKRLLRHVRTEHDAQKEFSLRHVAEALGWGPRRTNVAARLLDREGFIDGERTTGTAPYAFEVATILAKGRRS